MGNWQARYVYEDGIDHPRCMDRADIADVNGNQNTTEVLRFQYHQQALGSVTEVTQPTGAVVEWVTYDAYGAPTLRNQSGASVPQSALGNPLLLAGREYDAETGLYYYRARTYDPAAGRFLQRDPAGFVAGLSLYLFLSGNPASREDPLGLDDDGSGQRRDDRDRDAERERNREQRQEERASHGDEASKEANARRDAGEEGVQSDRTNEGNRGQEKIDAIEFKEKHGPAKIADSLGKAEQQEEEETKDVTAETMEERKRRRTNGRDVAERTLQREAAIAEMERWARELEGPPMPHPAARPAPHSAGSTPTAAPASSGGAAALPLSLGAGPVTSPLAGPAPGSCSPALGGPQGAPFGSGIPRPTKLGPDLLPGTPASQVGGGISGSPAGWVGGGGGGSGFVGPPRPAEVMR